MRIKTKEDRRDRIKYRIRKRVRGTEARPRLTVFRSLSHVYVQVIDDEQGVTLASASTIDHELREKVKGLKKVEQARLVGELVAKRATGNGIKQVVFDRGGFRFSGRVKALADAARGAGLEF